MMDNVTLLQVVTGEISGYPLGLLCALGNCFGLLPGSHVRELLSALGLSLLGLLLRLLNCLVVGVPSVVPYNALGHCMVLTVHVNHHLAWVFMPPDKFALRSLWKTRLAAVH